MKKLITLFFVLFVISVSGHEFWLQPDKFIYKPGEKATIKFMVGEDFEGKNWNGNRSKINFLYLYQNGIKTDLSPTMSENNGDSIQLTLVKQGTTLIEYNSLNSFIELEAEKFNAYLEEDGLREALAYRKLHNETDSMGREQYQRSVKTILQVGSAYDSSFKQSSPLPLDIIPIDHPYLVRDRQKMAVKILFNKKPLADQLIKVWFRDDNKTIKDDLLTDHDGIISFKVKKTGRWMVSTVKMEHLENNTKAGWQSYWASLTWGYD